MLPRAATRATSDGRLDGLLEGHDLIPPCLHRGEDGLLVFLLDLQLLERCLQMPDHLVERLLGDVEIGVGFVQVPALILARPAGNDGQQRRRAVWPGRGSPWNRSHRACPDNSREPEDEKLPQRLWTLPAARNQAR